MVEILSKMWDLHIKCQIIVNTSLVVLGLLAHCLQCCTACKIKMAVRGPQNGRQALERGLTYRVSLKTVATFISSISRLPRGLEILSWTFFNSPYLVDFRDIQFLGGHHLYMNFCALR